MADRSLETKFWHWSRIPIGAVVLSIFPLVPEARAQAPDTLNLGLQPSHDLEAAVVATLSPGQYTAQVRGKADASGIGVVQVYFLQ